MFSNETTTFVIDGKGAAALLRARVGEAASALTAATGVRPGLAVVIAGSDPASQVYVASKGRAARELGYHSLQFDLPESVSESELLDTVRTLNADRSIHGILVQLPLPRGIDEKRILEAIDPSKDVDGFHPVNAGLLAIGDRSRALVPCTPAGAMRLLLDASARLGRSLAGLEAVVVGRSNIVGKPIAQLLLQADCTVTIAHSRSRDLAGLVGRADIVVAAAGRPQMIRGAWLKPGAMVIDVGINRIPAPERGLDAAGIPKTRLVGDVAYEEALGRAAAMTPVPGGVGPMTIAMLMANTLTAACRIAGQPDPVL